VQRLRILLGVRNSVDDKVLLLPVSRRWRLLLVVVFTHLITLGWLWVRTGVGQVGFFEGGPGVAYLPTSDEASRLLDMARRHLEEGRWFDGVSVLEEVIERFPDRVVPVGEGLYVSARHYAHCLLARGAPEARKLYRQKVDRQADVLYRRAVEEQDLAALRRVVSQYFCSSVGDEAIELLGDYALEAGRFDEAIAWWNRLLVRSKEPQQAELGYPDPQVDLARVAAKRMLAHLFAGRVDEARRAWEQFRRDHPDAMGVLAGREGLWIDHLGHLLEGLDRSPPASASTLSDWLTFARNVERRGVAPQAVDIGSVQWVAELPPAVAAPAGLPRFAEPVQPQGVDRSLFHPIVVRGHVLVAGAAEVRAYHLQKGPGEGGQPAWSYRLNEENWPVPYGRGGFFAEVMGPQYTLSSDGRYVFARLGAPSIPPVKRTGRVIETYLVALDALAEGKEVWRERLEEPDTVFEGAPAVVGSRLYVATRRGGSMIGSILRCYDWQRDQLVWERLVCEAPQTGRYSDFLDGSQGLVTVAEGAVFYVSNLGAVAALEADTGEIRWIWTYPRVLVPYRSGGAPCNPAVYHNGRLFVAPEDSSQITCLDAATGRVLWQTPPGQNEPGRLDYLLGVVGGKLIALGRQVVAYNVEHGGVEWQFPTEGGAIQPAGRGAIAGSLVYVPDRTQLHLIDSQTGLPVRPAVELLNQYNLRPGNLVVAEGCLVVASDRLAVLCEYGIQIQRYQEQIARQPDAAHLYLRLAQLLEQVSREEEALEQYRQAIRRIKPGEPFQGESLETAARKGLYQLLLKQARRQVQGARWLEATQLLDEAVSVATTADSELRARLELAAVLEKAGQAKEALRVYQEILQKPALRSLPLALSDHRAVRADLVVADRIEMLLQQHGRGLYQPYEDQMGTQLQEAQASSRPELVVEALARYPNSQRRFEAWKTLGDLLVHQKQWTEAADAYRLAAWAPEAPPEIRKAALLGLARTLEAQRLWAAAVHVWQQLRGEFATVPLDPFGQETIAGYVERKLSEEPYRWALQGSEPLQLPVAWRNHVRWDPGVRVVLPEGRPPLGFPLMVLVHRDDRIMAADAITGTICWEQKAPMPLTWAGFAGELLVLGEEQKIQAVSPATGTAVWTYQSQPKQSNEASEAAPAEALAADQRLLVSVEGGARQAARGAGQVEGTGGPRRLPLFRSSSLSRSGLAVVGVGDDRLYVRVSATKLVALAVATGEEQWTYEPAGGELGPLAAVGQQYLVVWVRDPMPSGKPSTRTVVLDGDGRVRWELKGAGSEWTRPPLWLDNTHLLLIWDNRLAELVELRSGQVLWHYEAPSYTERGLEAIHGPGRSLFLLAGPDLIRIHPDTGQRLWKTRIADAPPEDDAGVWAIDESRFYCVTRSGNLRAWSIQDGTLTWQHYLTGLLPALRWRLLAVKPYVVAVPAEPPVASSAYPVVILEAPTGRLQQRLWLRNESDWSGRVLTASAVQPRPGDRSQAAVRWRPVTTAGLVLLVSAEGVEVLGPAQAGALP
jgi:outer membrane protein assembly factor BamB